MTLTELFTNIANAIRAKTGNTEPIIAEDFPSAIEAIPVGSTIDLDAEVTEQETIAASQDILVGDIMAALEGKAAGGGSSEVSMITTTISEEQADWVSTLTIPELIGAKYFIIQGNPWTTDMMKSASYYDDNYIIHQLIYLNGLVYCSYPFNSGITGSIPLYTNSGIDCSEDFSFNQETGTITANGLHIFYKLSADTSTTGIAYTVYRIG